MHAMYAMYAMYVSMSMYLYAICPVAFFLCTGKCSHNSAFLPSLLPGTLEKSGQWHLSLSIFSSMTSKRILPDLLTHNSVTRQG